VQADVHKDSRVGSGVVRYPGVCDYGATSVSSSLTCHDQSFPYASKTSHFEIETLRVPGVFLLRHKTSETASLPLTRTKLSQTGAKPL
jgi:hypothetical protein